jgi:UDP-N-acetylglucosamine diphosphorylase / glucose-1-phosphate thymidylyltransferase / UDP-N-acetylgalactosamine diphosphorylase / glucosamine-1-phosphate N-acetyltransferase / galactosamine-1-phosphate N-acetyltransferase
MKVNMLGSLFPKILDLEDSVIENLPKWDGIEDTPWEILSKKNSNNLNKQLIDFINNKINLKATKELMIDETNGRVYIHPSAKIGEFVKIEGPSYIGKNVEIRHCAYIRQGSWICQNAIIGHSSEIKNSILLPGSKAPHFNYVGDSIIGFDVNLGAGVKLSNVRHDKRNIIIELENGEKRVTYLKKLGALIGDGSGLGCNVVTNPGTIISPNTMIMPNETLSGWNC